MRPSAGLALLFLCLALLRPSAGNAPPPVATDTCTTSCCYSCASSALRSQWQVTGLPVMPPEKATGTKAFLFDDTDACRFPETSKDKPPLSTCSGGICIEMLTVANGVYSVLRGCLTDFNPQVPTLSGTGCTYSKSEKTAIISNLAIEPLNNVHIGVKLCNAKGATPCNLDLQPTRPFADDEVVKNDVSAWADKKCDKASSGVQCLNCYRYDWEGDCHWNYREYCQGAWCSKTIGYVNGRWLETRGCAPINPLNIQQCTKIERDSQIDQISGSTIPLHLSTEQCFCQTDKCNGALGTKLAIGPAVLTPLALAMLALLI